MQAVEKEHGKFIQWADKKPSQQNIITRFCRSAARIFLICASEFKKNELSLRSAALTYTILLSLVPILAMSTAIVKGLGGGDQLKEMVYNYLDTLDHSNHTAPAKIDPATVDKTVSTGEAAALSEPAPAVTSKPANGGSMTKHLRSAVNQLFEYVDKTNFATLGTFGVLGIFLSVLLVFNHIENAMNSIWHVANSRPLLRKISDYITLLILMPVSINVAFASSAVLKNQNLNNKLDIVIPIEWMQELIFKLIPISFIAITLFIIYLFFPNTKVKSLPAMIGAFLGATLWFGIQSMYISLQIGVSNYNAIYGSFATLPLFLVWIYMGWVFILFGAEIAYAIQNRNSYRLIEHPGVPSLRLSAAFDIMEMVYAQHAQGIPKKIEEIVDSLQPIHSQAIKETIALLIKSRLLYLVSDKTALLPAQPKENLKHGAIIQAIIGDESSDTMGGEETRKTLTKITDQEKVTEECGAKPSENEQGEKQEVSTLPQDEKVYNTSK